MQKAAGAGRLADADELSLSIDQTNRGRRTRHAFRFGAEEEAEHLVEIGRTDIAALSRASPAFVSQDD